MNEDQKIEKEAIRYVKQNKKKIVDGIVKGVAPVNRAVAIFMAGSPGAGKTEFSIRFLEERFEPNSVVRIDPDEIRENFPNYDGQKAYLYQRAVSLVVEKVLDYVFHNSMHFLLDGTLAHLKVAEKNIKRAIRDKRLIHINYLYQPKVVAWEFTKKREMVINRKITKAVFEESFKKSKFVVGDIKSKFAKEVTVDLIVRNVKTNKYKYYFNQSSADILAVDKNDKL